MSGGGPATLSLKVVTPHRLLVEAEVPGVNLPGLDGELGILPGHRPLVAALGSGELSYEIEGRRETWRVQGGHAEIHAGSVLVFTELAEDEAERA
jgi:F-type H+-transporting ATPase subunit epsilon